MASKLLLLLLLGLLGLWPLGSTSAESAATTSLSRAGEILYIEGFSHGCV